MLKNKAIVIILILGVAGLLGFITWHKKAPVPASETAETGLFKSDDFGKGWQTQSHGLPADIMVKYVSQLEGQVLLGTSAGYYLSETDGSWRLLAAVPFKTISALYATREAVYAVTVQDQLLKFHSGDTDWTEVSAALPAKGFDCVLKQGNVLLVGGAQGIFRSADEGKTWTRVTGDGMGHFSSMTEKDGVVFSSSNRGILRSSDGGQHWDWALDHCGTRKVRVVDGQLVALTEPFGVKVSADGGQTWEERSLELPGKNMIFSLVKVGSYWVCSLESGIFRSEDQGKHWSMINTLNAFFPFREMNDKPVVDLQATDNGILYGLQGGGGC